MVPSLGLQNIRQPAIDQIFHRHRMDIARGIDLEQELEKILRSQAPDLLATLLAIEARVVAGTIEALVRSDVVQAKTLVRAEDREGDDVSFRTDAAGNGLAQLDEDP